MYSLLWDTVDILYYNENYNNNNYKNWGKPYIACSRVFIGHAESMKAFKYVYSATAIGISWVSTSKSL